MCVFIFIIYKIFLLRRYLCCFGLLFRILKDLLFPLDADQQRREKLKKDLTKCENEFKITKNVMQTNSKNNSKSFFKTMQKVS